MMLELYGRDAPKRHELYKANLEARRYTCREYGDRCSDWLLAEALRPNGHAMPQDQRRCLDKKDCLQEIPSLTAALPSRDLG